MRKFLELVAAAETMRFAPDRWGLPPRAFLNPADFQNGESPGTAYVAPEYPKFAPPKWQEGIVEYVSEQECGEIFERHYKNLTQRLWLDYQFAHAKALEAARQERYRQRRIRRNKRAYNYWCGYYLGMKAAFAIAEAYFRYKSKTFPYK